MGFDLDGDFGNLSSFKMDMPDFDFSSPSKKTTKTKESSDDKSSGNIKQKKDLFAFSYDFNAYESIHYINIILEIIFMSIWNYLAPCFSASRLDDFDLDSSPPKKGRETTTKTMDCEEISAGRKFDKSDALDFGLDLPVTGQASSKVKTDVKANASAEIEKQTSNTTDTMVVDNSTNSKQATVESIENSEAVESPQSPRLNSSKTHMMCLQPQSVNTSPLKTSCPTVEEIEEPCPSNESTAPSPLHASETAHTAVNRETSPDIHEICKSGTKEDSPRDLDQNAYNKMISIMESSYEKTEPNISSQSCLDKTEHQQEEMSTDTQAEIRDQTRRTLCDQDAGNISSGTRPSQTSKVQDSSVRLPLAPSHRLEKPRLLYHSPSIYGYFIILSVIKLGNWNIYVYIYIYI